MKIGSFELKLFKTPPPKVKKDVELGESGTSIYQGFVSDADYVPELTGSKAIETYDQMRKSDGIVKAALLACELPIRAANWYVKPATEEPKDKEIAEFISKNLFEGMTITWDDFLRQALLCLPFGYMVFEKVFTAFEFMGKQMIGWKKFAPRLPQTIMKWKTDNDEDGITQTVPSGGSISIPIEKLIIFTHDKEGDNWTGVSILRSAYRPWYFKEHIEKINAIAFERQGLGLPYVKLPPNATAKDIAAAEELLKNIRANEEAHIIEPAKWEIGFKDMMSKGTKDPDATIRRYNREILISVHAQFLDLGSGAVGSRALSVDHSTIFHNNLTAVAHLIRDSINKYAIKQLVDLNYTVKDYPTLEFSNIGVPNYEIIAKSLTSLIQNGAISTDDNLEKHLRQLMNLPEKPEEEEGDEDDEPKDNPKPNNTKKEASEFSCWRKLTFAEKKIEFAAIQKKMNESEDKLRIALGKILSESSNDLIRQMQIVLEAPSSPERRARLQKMSIKYKGEYRKELYGAINELFEYGKMMAAHEMNKAVPPSPASSLQDNSKLADGLTLMMAESLMKAGKLAMLTGFTQKKSSTEIIGAVTRMVRKEAKVIAFNTAAININGAMNQGRRASFGVYDKDIYAVQRSEILDNVTCNYCMSIDSRVFRKRDNFAKTDSIHSSCRGIWVEIMKAEEPKPKIAGMPQTLRNRFDSVNVFAPPRNPIVKKDSPAADFLRDQEKP